MEMLISIQAFERRTERGRFALVRSPGSWGCKAFLLSWDYFQITTNNKKKIIKHSSVFKRSENKNWHQLWVLYLPKPKGRRRWFVLVMIAGPRVVRLAARRTTTCTVGYDRARSVLNSYSQGMGLRQGLCAGDSSEILPRRGAYSPPSSHPTFFSFFFNSP